MEIDNKVFLIIVIVSLIVGISIAYKTVPLKSQDKTAQPTLGTPTPPGQLKLTSSKFENDGTIPVTFTCNGENINPPLTIENIPAGTQSLALIVEDPDAPLGTFVHWLVWNIVPETREIMAGKVPTRAQQGMNSANHAKYDGPCPPSRHRYFFTIYALDQSVGLDGKAKKDDLDKAMNGHVKEKAQLVGYFGN